MVNIKFNKWEKYNKRQKDIKRPYWFAMSNEIFLDPFYCDLDLKQRQAFLWLLCEASRQNKYGELEVSEKLFEQITGLNRSCLLDTIDAMYDKSLISKGAAGWRQEGGRIATATEHNKTEQRTIVQGEAVACAPEKFSFKESVDRIYQLYPRQEGKARGMAVLAKTLKTEQDLADFEKAVTNYAAKCRNENTEKKYIKLFSTFVGTKEVQTWRDYTNSNEKKTVILRGEEAERAINELLGKS